MKKFLAKFRPLMPYLFITEIVYYIVPMVAIVLNIFELLVFSMVVLFPIVTFVCALMSAKKYGFSWIYTITISVLFIPTVFIYYNLSALVYLLMYATASILGNMIGDFIKKKKNEIKTLRR